MSNDCIELKTKFELDIRRCCIQGSEITTLDKFKSFLQDLHKLTDIPFVLEYINSSDGSILPINNDDNFRWALKSVIMQPFRIILSRKGESIGERSGYTSASSKNKKSLKIPSMVQLEEKQQQGLKQGGGLRQNGITIKDDFRRVSSIIDVDVVPTTFRRVKLIRDCERPLGFYIRNGNTMRLTENGIERTNGIFISRLVPKGLAEMTGLIAVDDEVVEVNGIDVQNKSLDQVTDMMVANSNNLIITLKPANQNNTLASIRAKDLDRRYSSNSSYMNKSAISKQQQQPSTTFTPKNCNDDDYLMTL